MRLYAALPLLILLAPAVCAARQDGRLEGCVEPKTIAAVLGGLRPDNPRPLTVERLREMWPTYPVDAQVVSSDDSRFFKSDDRILGGHCECCETFGFKVVREGAAAPRELHNVIVNYSARRRAALVETASLFARALGLGAADLKTVGAEDWQDFRWEKYKGEERRLYAIDLRFAREAGLWKMYFSTTFYVVEP